MILCVAVNPSVDKLFEVDHITVGEIHRPTSFVALAGGKGVHVAQVAKLLGADPLLVSPLAGHTGRWVEEQIAAHGIESRIVWAAGETRSSLSVAERSSGRLTEFYENGTPLSGEDWAQIEATVVAEVAHASWQALAGSLPPGAPDDGYVELIAAAKRAGVKTAVDTRGASLLNTLEAEPELVKINAREATELLEQPVRNVEEAGQAARVIRHRLGGEGHAAAVTVDEGVGLVDPSGAGWLGTVPVRGRYPVGSGDCFLAGLLVALERGDAWSDAMRLALGTAAANAEVPGAAVFDAGRAGELATGAECWDT